MSDCSICCETFNKSNHRRIDCKTCESKETQVCQSCAKRYILDLPTDPSCMVCKIEWDTEFLCDNFTKTFINKELKVHRENYLLEKQIALLPETQDYAENIKLCDKLEKQKEELMKEKRALELKLRNLNTNIRDVESTIRQIRYGNYTKQKTEFTFKCPVENCNGFLNDKYTCGICENNICKHCMEIKEENHECDEEKKMTVAMIKKDSKPCPKCGQLINKSEGCDQMYCIKCHTAFSWRTGIIERGTVHNPEYYRWMRENGRDIPRNPLDVQYDPCGNVLITYTVLLTTLRKYYKPDSITTNRYGNRIYTDKSETVKICNMHRMIHHIDHLNRIFNNENDNKNDILRTYRANYILSKITKVELKKKLQMLEKKYNKNKKLNDIWNLLRYVLIEYIGKISETNYTLREGTDIIENIIKESEKIRKYCNENFSKIGSIFNMTYPGISNEWIQIYNWETYIRNKNNPTTHIN